MTPLRLLLFPPLRLLLFWFLTICSSPAATLMPLQTLVDLHTYSGVLGISLSRDGKTLCYLTRPSSGPGTVVNVLDVVTSTLKAQVTITQTDLSAGAFGQFHWISSSRFLVELGYGAMVTLDTSGKNLTRLVDPKNPVWQQAESLRFIGMPSSEPGAIYLTGSRPKPGDAATSLQMSFRVNLDTGAVEKLAEEEWAGTIVFDQQGRMRIKAARFGAAPQFLHRAPDGSWQPLDQLAGTAGAAPFDVDAAQYFGQRSLPIGFGDDPHLLYIASNAGRDTQGVYAIDTRTGRRTGLAIEHPSYDLTGSPDAPPPAQMLIFDRANHALVGVHYVGLKLNRLWQDPELAKVQARIDALAGQDNVIIDEWDDARERFLIRRLTHTRQPSYALYFRSEDKLRAYGTEQAAGKSPPPAYTTPWAFKRESGEPLTGYLTLPPTPRAKPIPIVVRMNPTPYRASPGYVTDVAALAQMGYAVLEVNHRGVIGFGTKHWVAARGRAEQMAAEDIFLAVDRLAGQAGLDRSKVAIFQNAFRSYLALRVAQIASDRIACVALVSPGADVEGWTPDQTGFMAETRRWFAGPDIKQWREHSTIDQAGKLRKPLLIADFMGPSTVLERPIDTLCRRMTAAGNEPRREVIKDPFGPLRNARCLALTEEFLAKHLDAPPR